MSTFEDRESTILLKIKQFQRKLDELKIEIEEKGSTIRDVKAKYQASKEIESLRDYMLNNLQQESQVQRATLENNRKDLLKLKDDKYDLENENLFLNEKIRTLRQNNEDIHFEEQSLERKFNQVDREYYGSKERFLQNEKNKVSNYKEDQFQKLKFDQINNEINNTQKSNDECIRKIDEIKERIYKERENLNFERDQYEEIVSLNDKLSDNLMGRQKEISLLDMKIKNIKSEINENKGISNSSQIENDNVLKKLQVLYDQIFAINTANKDINLKLNQIVVSLEKHASLLENDFAEMNRSQQIQNKILNDFKEIASFKNILDSLKYENN